MGKVAGPYSGAGPRRVARERDTLVEAHTGVVAGLVPATPDFKRQRAKAIGGAGTSPATTRREGRCFSLCFNLTEIHLSRRARERRLASDHVGGLFRHHQNR